MAVLNDEEVAAWRALLRAHARLVDVLGHELEREKGITLAQYEVMTFLSDAPQRRMRMSELADAVLLSRSGLTRLIDRLTDSGLVCREDCPEDRRGSYAVLTDEGLERLRDAWTVHARGVAEHFAASLTESETRMLERALSKVAPATRSCLEVA